MYGSFDRGDTDTKLLQVLKDVNWTIREGEKWHLQGANGMLMILINLIIDIT